MYIGFIGMLIVLVKFLLFLFFSYIIIDLEIFFGVSLNLSVCFEVNGVCEKVI